MNDEHPGNRTWGNPIGQGIIIGAHDAACRIEGCIVGSAVSAWVCTPQECTVVVRVEPSGHWEFKDCTIHLEPLDKDHE